MTRGRPSGRPGGHREGGRGSSEAGVREGAGAGLPSPRTWKRLRLPPCVLASGEEGADAESGPDVLAGQVAEDQVAEAARVAGGQPASELGARGGRGPRVAETVAQIAEVPGGAQVAFEVHGHGLEGGRGGDVDQVRPGR